ncbi:MAG: transporter [Gammaproteobacteria bacterium RIFCSPHIGHO2_12_FULL_45_9]|nr:MAG: transporter [Gammaproteobacteria bacterium RIFCSPHIGHO2_12_FULL_45_9]
MKRMRRLLIFIPLIVGGCAYTADDQQPNVPVQSKWTVQNQHMTQTNHPNLPYVAWWQGFHDETLNHLMTVGLAHNNSLNISRGHIEAAEGELKKIQLQWVPDVTALVGYNNTPAVGSPGALILLSVDYMMNLFTQIKQQKKAEYELAEVKAEDDAVKLSVISQIAAGYFTYLAEVEHAHLLQVLAQDISALADIADRVYQGGLSSDIPVEDLRSAVHQIQGEQERVAHNIVVSRNALRFLLNENPGEIHSTKTFNALNNHQIVLGAWPMTVLENRPDMQQAKNQLRAANEGIGLAASVWLPSIGINEYGGATGGNSSWHFPTPFMQNAVNFNDEVLSIPLFRMSTLGEIAKARGLNKMAYYHYIETLQKALRDTTNALSANLRLTNRLMQTERSEQRLDKAYQLHSKLYRRGIMSYMSTLNSKIALDRANIQINQDKLQQLLTFVNVYQELAGGYKAG